ncbi:hypothetical protein ACVI1J_006886 [Bradyrhizobium diazoefficiens]
MSGLSRQILLGCLGRGKLGGETGPLVLQARFLPPEIVEPGAIPARVHDAQEHGSGTKPGLIGDGLGGDHAAADRRAQGDETRIQHRLDARVLPDRTQRQPAEHGDDGKSDGDLGAASQMRPARPWFRRRLRLACVAGFVIGEQLLVQRLL